MSYEQSEAIIDPPPIDAIPMMKEGKAKDAVNDVPYVGSPTAKGDDTITTATTSGSIYGGSRSSQGQERPLRGRDISISNEERIEEALVQKDHLIAQNQGLEKLEAYVLSNDENAVPEDAYSVSTRMDEEFSLNLSRPTGTGSHQLELWIGEVNIAVTKGPIPLTIQTKPAPKDQSVSAASPRSRIALSPAHRNGHKLATLQSSSDARSKQLVSLTKSSKGSVARSPSKPLKHGDFHPLEQLSLTKSSKGSARSPSKSPRHGGFPPVEQLYSKNHLSHEDTPKMNNSKFILASIEGKYKSLREDLIEDPTFDEPPPSFIEEEVDEEEDERHEESDYRRPPTRWQNQTARVHSLVSGNLASSDPLRPPDFSVRDHFSLGLLSTRSSGILSANSWSSGSTFDSGAGKGCGLFLCE